MHITYVHYLQQGDTALNHVRQFAAAAEALGHDVRLLSMNHSVRSPLSTGESIAGPSDKRELLKRLLRFYLHEPKELLLNVPHLRFLKRALRESKPEVVLFRTHLLTFAPVEAASSLDLPSVLEVNSPILEGKIYGGRYYRLPRIPDAVERWNCRRAEAITAVSSALSDHLCSAHNLPRNKVFVVPNGADPRLFDPSTAPKSEIRFKIPPRSPIIGFVGAFYKWHGPEILAEMILKVADARPDAFFLIVGDGPEHSAVAERVEKVGPRVLFTGRVPHAQVPGLVSLMDIGVLPETAFYCSPLKVIEWMAAGKPVVAPAYGPLTEVIDDGMDGLLFPPRDSDALVAAILRLIDDPDLRRRLGANAAARVSKNLTWRHNASRVLEACNYALEQRSESRPR